MNQASNWGSSILYLSANLQGTTQLDFSLDAFTIGSIWISSSIVLNVFRKYYDVLFFYEFLIYLWYFLAISVMFRVSTSVRMSYYTLFTISSTYALIVS